MSGEHTVDPAGSPPAPLRLAVVAHKGGVGKTTVSVNLGGAYAALGQRVLLIDADPQGSLADALDLVPTPPTLLDVLTGEVTAAAAARPTTVPRLALLSAGDDLADVEDRLYGRTGWHLALRHALRPLPQYDVVIIDTPPGLGVLSFMGMLGADGVLVLCPPEFLAQRALPKVLATLERARRLAPDLTLAGILPTLVGGGSRHQHTTLAELTAQYGALVLPPVPRRALLQDAARAGLPITAAAPRSAVAGLFTTLARILQERAGQVASPMPDASTNI